MPRPSTIQRFLLRGPGFFCDACLASALGLSLDDVRRDAREGHPGAFMLRYGVCSVCGIENEVIGIRTSA